MRRVRSRKAMRSVLGILSLVLALALAIIAPAQNAYAEGKSSSVRMMRMPDGVPCTQSDCAAMPDCKMMPSVFSGTILGPSVASFSVMLAVRQFSFPARPIQFLASLPADGLRKPQKSDRPGALDASLTAWETTKWVLRSG